MVYGVVAMALFAYNPVVGGIAFLEKEPNTFLCKTMGNKDWKECQKAEICRNRTQEGFHFLADKTDPDYLDNWELKLDLLCESSSKVGFLGSSFFIGVIFGMLITPKLSDLYGRKQPFVWTMILSIIGQAGLMFCDDLEEALIFMTICGVTFPGKSVVGLNYLLEFFHEKHHPNAVTLYFVLDILSYFVLVAFY